MDKPLRPLANRFCGCSVWALAPFFVVFGALLFASLFPLAKRKSGWGICGSSCLVVFCGFCVLFYSICLLKMDMLCPCTNVFPTAYAHVRTEPLARHRPYSRKKKAVKKPGGGVAFFRVLALPFGATGSVSAFLRISSAIAFIGSKGLCIPWSVFFDDYTALSPSGLELDTTFYAEALFKLLGINFASEGSKAPPFSDCFKTLGPRGQSWTHGGEVEGTSRMH